jgi:hypothetical protein
MGINGMEPMDDASKAKLYDSLRRPDLWDRCHRYGWVITLVLTILFQIAMWAATIGSFKQSVEDMKNDFGQRIDRLERQVDKILEKY